MKRINGTYLDHLLSIIIYGILFGWILFFIRDITLKEWSILWITSATIIWVAVILKIRMSGKVNSTLKLDMNKRTLIFDELTVRPNQIRKISIFVQRARFYNYKYIDFEIEFDGNLIKKRIQNMVAMTFLDVKWDYPKSLQLLINQIPELKEKIKE
jgi:cell division protein FtsW (lipid II flippase)